MAVITVHSCTCPEATHTANNRANLSDIWQTPEWIGESNAYKGRHFPICSRCGTVGPIVPGHKEGDYKDMATYIQKVREDRVVSLCHRCNKEESKGRHPCPSCIERHREDPDHWIRYIGRDQEVCPECRTPEEKAASEVKAIGFRRFVRGVRDRDNAKRREIYRERKEASTS
jgi:hypothetical protein